jgi:hypothetical protein
MKAGWGLPPVSTPTVPSSFADDTRRREVLAEVEEGQPEVIVLFGDQPIRYWLAAYAPRWRCLSDFGKTPETYGQLHPIAINGKKYMVLPLAHPRQVGALGKHSTTWHELHRNWRMLVAPGLL